jgi:hypothetical protein
LKDTLLNDIFNTVDSFDKEIKESFYKKFLKDTEIHKVTRVSFYIRTLQDAVKLAEAFIKVKNKYFGEGKMRIYREFINNSNTSSSILNQIQRNLYTNSNTNSNTIEISIALAQHPHCNVELAQAIITRSEKFDEASKNSIYIELAKHTHIYEAIASHRNTDCATLEKIIQAMNLWIQFGFDITSQRIANIYIAVAAHENTNPEILRQIFAQSQVINLTIADRGRIYIAVAKNQNTNPEILRQIFAQAIDMPDEDRGRIYIAVANNRNTNQEILRQIFAQSQVINFTIPDRARIYIAVAKNQNTNAATLRNIINKTTVNLSKTERADIYLAVAKNQNTNAATLRNIINKTTVNLSKTERANIYLEVARNRHTEENTLGAIVDQANALLADDPAAIVDIYIAVVRRTLTNPDILNNIVNQTLNLRDQDIKDIYTVMQPQDTVRLDLLAKNVFLESEINALILEQQENNIKRHNFALLSQEERQNISSIANNMFYSRPIRHLKQRKGIQQPSRTQIEELESHIINNPNNKRVRIDNLQSQPNFSSLLKEQKNQAIQQNIKNYL